MQCTIYLKNDITLFLWKLQRIIYGIPTCIDFVNSNTIFLDIYNDNIRSWGHSS